VEDAPKPAEPVVPSAPSTLPPQVTQPPTQATQPPPPPPPPPPPTSKPKVAAPHTVTHQPSNQQAAIVKLPPADPTTEITGTRSEYRVKMNRMRLRIAQRLKDAQNVNAMLTTFNEVDMR